MRTNSSSDDYFDGSSDRPVARTTTRIAHLLRYILPVALAVRIATYFFYDDRWAQRVDAAFSVAFLVVIVLFFYHQSAPRLCVKCMEEVPPDAAERAERRRFFLWFHHAVETYRWRSIVIYLGLVAIYFLGDRYGSYLVRVLTNIPIDAVFFSLVYSGWVHHRLRPWCPYCRRWDDDGPAERIPDPDPADAKKVPR